ncbi:MULTISPECIES: benzoate 1,2-dioxygenase small subunit [Modicisalibacter]|uniref:Benzoate 1,2-dioxygenase small subunit n=1 Tax=Modicisalibacter tunisiensis TaxID=390637 RepID=A0ABS7WZ07_9GAMM|nr:MULTISPECIES: benzoate 1,2-dioxygenase small subunit [Modicisalibacter]MBZ9539018.1 benzoate 1,2-dioxygenase small subunit [Modicisalibacter tunisiensis]MBZ9567585.1 benzoate 1,2-dioxygenase small subunit [Modicisalibacter tunisiensis]
MSISYLDIQAFLYREARLLDDRQWDEWLECYSKDAVFWMPAWDDDDQLTRDPHSEISLIYYPNREGLEDRVYRIKTERSGASTPEPRTTHQVSNLEVLSQEGDTVELRFNWHTLSHRYKRTDSYFGTCFYTLDVSGETPLIKKKVVQLNNDYIHQVIDIYHI